MRIVPLSALAAVLVLAACAPVSSPSPTLVATPGLAPIAPSPTTSVPVTAPTPTPTAEAIPSPTPTRRWQATAGLPPGYITALAASPDYGKDHTVFAGVRSNDPGNPFSGKVFLSTDGGWNWNAVDGNLPDFSVHSIAISPSFARDRTVFIGMGYLSMAEGRRKEEGRVFKSVDAGVTWQKADRGLPGFMVSDIAISPDYGNDKTLLATLTSDIRFDPASGGLYRSEDGGQTWKPSSNGLPLDLPATAVAFSPSFASDGIMFASTIYGGDNPGERDTVFKSTDRGKTWKTSNQGVPRGNQAGIFAISPAFATDRTIYFRASMCCGDPKGVYKSLDGGARWLPAFDEALNQHVGDLALSPHFPKDGSLLATTFRGVYVSMDRGTSWRPFNAGLLSHT